MTEPTKFSMLNLDLNSYAEVNEWINENNYHEVNFLMGNRIEIEKRLVISLPNLFGEIGGLNDFFATLVIILINGYQAKNFLLDSIGRFFLIKLSTNKGQSVNTSNLKSLFTDFKLSCCNKVKIWFLCKTCLTKRERKLK